MSFALFSFFINFSLCPQLSDKHSISLNYNTLKFQSIIILSSKGFLKKHYLFPFCAINHALRNGEKSCSLNAF